MGWRGGLIGVALVVAGCRGSKAVPAADPRPLRPRFGSTELRPPSTHALERVSESAAGGFASYIASDGSDVRQLLLLRTGSYTLTASGCEGLYRVQTGRWSRSGDRIELTPSETQGNDRFPLPSVLLVRERASVVVLRPTDGTPDFVPARDFEHLGANSTASQRSQP